MDNNKLMVTGKWHLVSGPGSTIVYADEHAFRLSCDMETKVCTEAIANIYKPSDGTGFVGIKLFPFSRTFEIVQNDDKAIKAVQKGRATVTTFKVDNVEETVCMQEKQIIKDKDGTIPEDSLWCLKIPEKHTAVKAKPKASN
ncbi:hypothetical protein [Aliikangiella coralliicola]|uniref:Uncharacterized protein n=1 Tax=Aliikangiella coralliicola TaxID=2592383 RepID=A0A545UJ98_9GAMM|nr:hypothetical protein [Aliikangiella coralliicola]TQV89539.1 hypothetical protein FLL46_01250 [Aliikangiella coralliicola]